MSDILNAHPVEVPFLACRLGGACTLVSRDAMLGRIGVAQCVRCSTVYAATNWAPRVCAHCGLAWGESLHDPCLGTLEGVTQACCGHGNPSLAYRQYADGRIVAGVA